MIETRVINKISEPDVEEYPEAAVLVTWDLHRDGEYSHSYDQTYNKDNFAQFQADVGMEFSQPYKQVFTLMEV